MSYECRECFGQTTVPRDGIDVECPTCYGAGYMPYRTDLCARLVRAWRRLTVPKEK